MGPGTKPMAGNFRLPRHLWGAVSTGVCASGSFGGKREGLHLILKAVWDPQDINSGEGGDSGRKML